MPLSMYLYVSVTNPGSTEVLVIGISSTPEKHVIVDSIGTLAVADVYLKAYYEREEILAFPTNLLTVTVPTVDMDLDIPEGGILYVGLKKTTPGAITQDIAIKYHYRE